MQRNAHTEASDTATPDLLSDYLPEWEWTKEGDFTTEEECRLSTPYSDTKAWIRMLRPEMVTGSSRLSGPPGLRARIERKYKGMSILEFMSRSHLY